MGTGVVDQLYSTFNSQIFSLFIALILAAAAFTGKLSMNASVICLALAWVVGCVGIYKSDVIRDWYLMISAWLALGSLLTLLMSWSQSSAPTTHKPEPTPTSHTGLPSPTLHKEASTTTRPQERTVDDTLQEVLAGKYSGRTIGDELADLQRQRHYLWIELKEAAPKDKPALIRKLEQKLRQQLQIGAHLQLFGKDKEQFDKIVKELKDLRDVEKTLKL